MIFGGSGVYPVRIPIRNKINRLAALWRALLVVCFFMAGCGDPQRPASTATAQLPPTEEPLPTATSTLTLQPPTSTPTLEPSLTATSAGTFTPSPTGTFTPLPTSVGSSLPAAGANTVNIYFIQPNSGTGACGDRLLAVGSGVKITGNIARDVAAGLRKLLSYKEKNYGDLYNSLATSKLRVEKVEFSKKSGLIEVYFSGDLHRPKDPCEKARVKAQIWATIRQFPEVKATNIFLGRVPLGDLVSNS
jgi:hypothetical protein